MTMPSAITLRFKEARNSFPVIEGKSTNNNLFLIWETLLPILMEIPYDQLASIHPLTGILTEAVRYATKHGGKAFKCPICLPLYDRGIPDNASTVVCARSEATHKSRLNDYASYKAAEQRSTMFLC